MCSLLILRPQTAKTNMAANVQFLYPSASHDYMSRPFCSHVAMLQDGASLGAYFVNKLTLPLVDFKMNVIKWKLHFVSCNFGLKSNL